MRKISKRKYIIFLHERNRELNQTVTDLQMILKATLEDLKSGNLISGDDAGTTAEAAIENIENAIGE